MKKVHFYKAKSRIGLTSKPVRQDSWNFGVEDAPDVILLDQFLGNFKDPQVDQFIFPNPEDIDPKDYWQVLAQNLEDFSHLINKTLIPGETQVVVGGDNSVTFSSILANLSAKIDIQNIGYIQFDSHGEMNSSQGSISHNFHGMYMRPFFDKFDVPEIEKLVSKKFEPSQAFFLGDQILDGDEQPFFLKKKFRVINRAKYLENEENIKKEFKQFISNFKHLHINFDIDIFDQSVAAAYGCLGDGRWMLEEVLDFLNILKTHPSLSFDLCEVNPLKPKATQTIKVAQQLLLTVLCYD